jgi:hypothetical protein
MPVNPQLTVTLCVASGKLTCAAGTRTRLRVRSTDAAQLELRRLDKTKTKLFPPRE